MARAALVALLLAGCAAAALAADRTLPTASASCKDQFDTIITQRYATDKTCADLIRKAMSTAPKSDADCPGGAKADAGSPVQKCLAKNEDTISDWSSFIKACEVLNVNERAGAGEAEAAADAKPSCFPRFNSLTAFKEYLSAGLLLAAAAAGAGLLLL